MTRVLLRSAITHVATPLLRAPTTVQAVVGGARDSHTGQEYCHVLWNKRALGHYLTRSYRHSKAELSWEYANDPLSLAVQMPNDGSIKSGFAPACTDKQVVCTTYPADPTLHKAQCGIN